jgi:hypothetical protein
LRQRELKKEHCPRKSHDTPTLASAPPHHAAQERHKDARYVPSHIRSGLDVATVVFSHVQCVKTRDNLARVSKLWRDASKPAAAYPRRFDFDAFPTKDSWKWCYLIKNMMDNDEALSLPYERVVGLLGEAAKNVCDDAASRGSVRLLKWARENNRACLEYTHVHLRSY